MSLQFILVIRPCRRAHTSLYIITRDLIYYLRICNFEYTLYYAEGYFLRMSLERDEHVNCLMQMTLRKHTIYTQFQWSYQQEFFNVLHRKVPQKSYLAKSVMIKTFENISKQKYNLRSFSLCNHFKTNIVQEFNGK